MKTEELLEIFRRDVRGAFTYVVEEDGVMCARMLKPGDLVFSITRLNRLEQLIRVYADDMDGTAGEEALNQLTQLVKK